MVGRPDEIKGQGVVAFVTLKGDQKAGKDLAEALRKHVGKEIGSIAKPDEIRFTEALPKTRSGKINAPVTQGSRQRSGGYGRYDHAGGFIDLGEAAGERGLKLMYSGRAYE